MGPEGLAEPPAQPRGQGGAGPAGRHGHRDGPLAVDRGKEEAAVLGVVGAVDPDAGRLGVRRHPAVDLGDPGRGDHQAVAGRLAGADTGAARS